MSVRAGTRIVGVLALAYLVSVTGLAALFITIGYALQRMPRFPGVVEEAYAGRVIGALDRLLRPLDLVAAVDGVQPHAEDSPAA